MCAHNSSIKYDKTNSLPTTRSQKSCLCPDRGNTHEYSPWSCICTVLIVSRHSSAVHCTPYLPDWRCIVVSLCPLYSSTLSTCRE